MFPFPFLIGLGGTVLSGIASFALGGLPIGQILVTILQFVTAVLTELIKLIFDLARTSQGRCLLGIAATAIFGLWLWHHVDDLGYQRGYIAGAAYAKQHCPPPAPPKKKSR
jgi:hypothetical protein